MRLWTMQPVAVYEEIMNTGTYICNPNKVGEPSFLDRYDWLNGKLNEVDQRPENVNYPVWAWYRFDGKEKKPDLRHSCYGPRGEKMVCLELEVPGEKVLLSDFDLWHFPLNGWWLDECFFDEYSEEDYDKNHEWFKSLSTEEQDALKEKSWEQIFDITPYENDWIKKGEYVQAVFWVLKKEYIKKVQYFTAR